MLLVVTIVDERVGEEVMYDVIHGLDDVIPAFFVVSTSSTLSRVVMTDANVLVMVGILVVSSVVNSVEVNSFCIAK